MRFNILLACTAPLLLTIEATALQRTVLEFLSLARRASPDAPDGYTPKAVDCPSTRPSIRSASTLSPEESSWLEVRRNKTVEPMRDFLKRVNITGFDVDSYISDASRNVSALPNIGITFSGGGWRALFNGAGALAAFDDRTTGSTDAGQIGGVLQASTYMVGVSGGNWLVGSIFVNNFTSVQAILDTNSDESGSLWDFTNSILEGPKTSKVQLFSTASYWTELVSAVNGKKDAGYDTSITDYWGRGLSYYLINATDGGPAYTWSSIANDSSFSNGEAPMPISVTDGRAPGQVIIPSNTTNYEMNPWEIGTWDPTVFGFAPMKYAGSRFSGGKLGANESCIAGFDNAGFVMGTSSSLFNAIYEDLNSTSGSGIPSFFIQAIDEIVAHISSSDDDISDWNPNPFYLYNTDTNSGALSNRLTLVDGGEDGQNIGFSPLIEPRRNVDIIFAIDSSADIPAGGASSANWPNGTAMIATYERYATGQGIANGTIFPAIPDVNTFINDGLNSRPTFFGCNSSAEINSRTPLVVYLPNAPYVYDSNVSTFMLSYTYPERNSIINNGYDVATQGNGTVDSQWPTCVGCAILSRSLERTGTKMPDVCQTCMSRYCWDGTRNSSTPAPYTPSLKLGNSSTTTSSSSSPTSTKNAALQMAPPHAKSLAASVLAVLAIVSI